MRSRWTRARDASCSRFRQSYFLCLHADYLQICTSRVTVLGLTGWESGTCIIVQNMQNQRASDIWPDICLPSWALIDNQWVPDRKNTTQGRMQKSGRSNSLSNRSPVIMGFAQKHVVNPTPEILRWSHVTCRAVRAAKSPVCSPTVDTRPAQALLVVRKSCMTPQNVNLQASTSRCFKLGAPTYY
jgi:hypothetical protein